MNEPTPRAVAKRKKLVPAVTGEPPNPNTPPAANPSGKIGVIVALLRRANGACMIEMTEATGWQAHSVRGAIAGSIKRKHDLIVTSEKLADIRTWRIEGEGP